MTPFATDDLYPVLKALSPALKSIDVRTVGVCSPSEEHWQNLVTSIIISDKTVDEVKAEHEKLPQVRNYENSFAIFMGAYAFNYLVFDKISNGEIRFPALTFGIYRVKTRAFDPLALKLTSTQERFEGSTCYVLRASDQGVIEDRKKLWNVVYQQNNFSNSVGFPNVQKLIQHCLKIDNYGFNVPKDVEIKILPLAKLANVQFSEKQVTVKIQKPPQLTGLQINFKLEPDRDGVWIKPCALEGTNDSIEVKIDELLPFDLLNLELIHRDSGLILDRTYKKVPLENVAEPFVKTLDAFCSLDKIERMLLKPQVYGKNPDKIFESAVTWLLCLAGFEAVHVGIIITKLNNKQEKFDELHLKNGYHIGSADIIAYDENERLILIDCDINTVDSKKVEKLAEMKQHFRENLKGYEKLYIVPILFTPSDFRGTSPSPEVMIADQAVIKRIFEAVAKGDQKKARSELYYSGT